VPEGDLVWNTAKRLHTALAGQVLTRSDFRVPRYATVSLAGQTVTEAVARGKHLLIRTDRGLTVHTHLKMEGAWRIQPAAGHPLRDSHRLRILLANSQWVAAGYQLGITEVLPTARENQVIGHLGPDLLGPDWDAAAAAARLSHDPGRPIGEALLDQRNVAGLGTVYLAETLFLRGVDPSRPVGSVEDLPALVDLGRRLLDANKERLGHVTTGDSRPGRENWVYGRAGRPCRRCGTPIRRGEAGPAGQERLRFWCPSCQRLAEAARPRARAARHRRSEPAGRVVSSVGRHGHDDRAGGTRSHRRQHRRRDTGKARPGRVRAPAGNLDGAPP
jgi:endonuclease-8